MSSIHMTHSEKKLFRLIQNDRSMEFQKMYYPSENKDLTKFNSEGVSLLGEAVKRDALRCAEIILENTIEEMTRLDKNGNMPISYMRQLNPSSEMIDLFERFGFDFSKSIGDRGNILHVIAPKGSKDLFERLVVTGANPIEQNSRDDKPFDIAKRWGNVELETHIDRSYTPGKQVSFDFNM